MNIIATAALAVLFAAAPVLAQAPRPPASGPNTFSDRLMKLDDLRRRSVLRRAILDNGLTCDRVVAGGPRGRWRNLVMWTARCGKGGPYGVFLGNDGSVQVRPCADLATLKLPTCRLPAEPKRRG